MVRIPLPQKVAPTSQIKSNRVIVVLVCFDSSPGSGQLTTGFYSSNVCFTFSNDKVVHPRISISAASTHSTIFEIVICDVYNRLDFRKRCGITSSFCFECEVVPFCDDLESVPCVESEIIFSKAIFLIPAATVMPLL